jgi:hypothetical protein
VAVTTISESSYALSESTCELWANVTAEKMKIRKTNEMKNLFAIEVTPLNPIVLNDRLNN